MMHLLHFLGLYFVHLIVIVRLCMDVLVKRECQVVVGMVNGKMVVGGYPSAALH